MTDKEAMTARCHEVADALIERLKRTTDPVWQHTRDEVIQEAISVFSSSKARIETLEARLDELEKALEPFAEAGEGVPPAPDDERACWVTADFKAPATMLMLTHGDFRRAFAALRSKGETGASCELRAKGKPYPRTCPVCGLGPCRAVWE